MYKLIFVLSLPLLFCFSTCRSSDQPAEQKNISVGDTIHAVENQTPVTQYIRETFYDSICNGIWTAVQISKDQPAVYFRQREIPIPNHEPEEDSILGQLEISRSPGQKPFQIIKYDIFDSPIGSVFNVSGPGFSGFCDLNYDGNLDLKFIVGTGSNAYTRNEEHAILLYDVAKGRYSLEKFEFSNPSFCPDSTISELWRNTMNSGTWSIRKWNGKEVVNVKYYCMEELTDIPENPKLGLKYRVILVKYVNNQPLPPDTSYIYYERLSEDLKELVGFFQ